MAIQQKLMQVRQELQDATESSHRDMNSVTLLAVSKGQEINKIRDAYQSGQKSFGESYVQESKVKIEQLQDLAICWHFIGPIQSNKTAEIAKDFDWVQSIDRVKIARRLNDQRPEKKGPLQVCVQVNLFEESTKQGATLAELPALLQQVEQLPQLNLRGIMAIPPKQSQPEQQFKQFAAIAELFKQYQTQFPHMDTLSMGMSGDMTAAIAAGSTLVRVGSAIFGPRPNNWKQTIQR